MLYHTMLQYFILYHSLVHYIIRGPGRPRLRRAAVARRRGGLVCLVMYWFVYIYYHIYIHIDIYIYIYVYTHIYIYVYICIYKYIALSLPVFLYIIGASSRPSAPLAGAEPWLPRALCARPVAASLSAYMYVCIYIYIYICMYTERERDIDIDVCVYTYMYIYIYPPARAARRPPAISRSRSRRLG